MHNQKKLLYVWVENYKNIEKMGFYISDKYIINVRKNNTENEEYEINYKKNPEYKQDILFNKNINIKAIIGKNGSGKSALLESIYGLSQNQVLYIFEENDSLQGYYLHNYNKTIHFNSSIKFEKISNINSNCILFSGIRSFPQENLKEPYYYAYSDVKEENDIYKNLSKILNKDKTIFDFLDKEFQRFSFDKFRLNISSKKVNQNITLMQKEKFPGLKNIELISFIPSNTEKYDKLDYVYYGFLKPEMATSSISQVVVLNFLEEVNNILKNYYNNKNFIDSYYKLALMFDRRFPQFDYVLWKNFVTEIINLFKKYNIDVNFDDLGKYALDTTFGLLVFLDDLKESQLLSSSFYDYKSFCDEPLRKIIKLNEFNVEDYIKCINNENDIYNELKEQLKSYLPNKIYQNITHEFYNSLGKQYTYNSLSQGEKTILKIFLDLYLVFYKSTNKPIILLFDEVELSFHPEWKRKYIYFIERFINKIDSKKENIFNILLTTHSPYVLSDLSQKHVIKLNNECFNCVIEQNINKTFASNIQTLLSDSFFIQNNVGEYAENKLQKIINIINNNAITKDNKVEIKQIIDLVGDTILRNILNAQYEWKLKNAKDK